MLEDFINNLHSADSIVDKKFQKNTYRKILPIRLFNYWFNKLFSENMNVGALTKEGKDKKEAVKRINQIMKRSNFRDAVSKYLSKKSMGEGYGAITIKLVDDLKGEPIPMFQVAEGVVRYSSFAETETSIQVIEKLTRGIVPIIRVKTYGKIFDTISYELGEGFNLSDYDGDDKQDIEKLLNTTKKFVHNYGFVRAIVFRNRVDDKHYDYGQNDLNGFEEIIDNIDLMNNRMLNEVDKNTTHISRTYSSGSVLGGEESDFFNFENQEGTIKETYRTLDTEEGVDSVVIQGDITLPNLRDAIKSAISELDQMTGIQVGYDALGKTNDTSTKSNMIGDPAHKEASLRRLIEQEFWTKLFEICIKLDPRKDIWEDVEEITITPRLNDFRNKVAMLDNIDKIAKYYPLKDMYIEMLDVSPQLAEDMVDNKEEEIKSKIVSALPAMNGNLPQNIEVDFKWGTKVEKQQPQQDIKEGE